LYVAFVSVAVQLLLNRPAELGGLFREGEFERFKQAIAIQIPLEMGLTDEVALVNSRLKRVRRTDWNLQILFWLSARQFVVQVPEELPPN